MNQLDKNFVEIVQQTIVNPNPLHIYNSLLLGKTLAVAKEVAAKKGFSLRPICIDGKGQTITLECQSSRMNIAIFDGIVTELISWG